MHWGMRRWYTFWESEGETIVESLPDYASPPESLWHASVKSPFKKLLRLNTRTGWMTTIPFHNSFQGFNICFSSVWTKNKRFLMCLQNWQVQIKRSYFLFNFVSIPLFYHKWPEEPWTKQTFPSKTLSKSIYPWKHAGFDEIAYFNGNTFDQKCSDHFR